MKRRNFISISTMTATGLTLLSPLEDLFGMSPADGRLSTLTTRSGYYTERGGTIGFLSTSEGIVVIDSQFPDQAKHFIEAVGKDFSGPFVLLMNTHHHGDHTAGNIAFKPYVNRVVAHVNSAKYQRMVAEERNTTGDQYYPTETYETIWRDQIGKMTISASYHGPAHTSGDSVIHMENEGIVHMGDLVFNRLHPYIDTGAGASIQNWIAVLQQTVKKFGDQVTYIFGHARDTDGVIGNSSDLVQMAHYLEALLETAQQGINRGDPVSSLDNITKLKGFEDYTGDRISNNLKAAWEALQKE